MAAIYGQILRELGLLSKGDLVVKTPADFVGSALGQSEEVSTCLEYTCKIQLGPEEIGS